MNKTNGKLNLQIFCAFFHEIIKMKFCKIHRYIVLSMFLGKNSLVHIYTFASFLFISVCRLPEIFRHNTKRAITLTSIFKKKYARVRV